MSYIHISRSPGIDTKTYQAVLDALGDEPIEGQLVHAVGEADGTLHIVDVWDTKAHADRFAAERLFPAFERVGVSPGTGGDYTAFDGDLRVATSTGAAARTER